MADVAREAFEADFRCAVLTASGAGTCIGLSYAGYVIPEMSDAMALLFVAGVLLIMLPPMVSTALWWAEVVRREGAKS